MNGLLPSDAGPRADAAMDGTIAKSALGVKEQPIDKE
jgi:hypothetical protein